MGEKRFISDYCKWAKKQGYRVYERLASEILAVAQNGMRVKTKIHKKGAEEKCKRLHFTPPGA